MFKYAVLVCVVLNSITGIFGLWDQETDCPLICTCHLEHLTETAIYRFMQKTKEKPVPGEIGNIENNEILNEDIADTFEILEEHGPTIIRSAICILQTETDPLQLLETLPKNIESLTIIQGYESGNKTIRTSSLRRFENLITVELIGANLQNQPLMSHLICEIDVAIPDLKYLNLERILIRNSKEYITEILKLVNMENVTFEFSQKFENAPHEITLVQKSSNDEVVVPYEVFKKEREENGEMPLFIGFKKLLLLRISNCNMRNINWEMFDGLHELLYLILEKNSLKFIPPFAFYGTPNLKTLSLAHNNLLDIQITDLAGLLQLEYVDFSFNNFTQLSELSFPPFPKLKLANFANNPISVIFSNTFEVMNTTNSLIIGSDAIPLTLVTNSLLGLEQLRKLTLNNLKMELLKRDLFTGMPNLDELILTGNITRIQYDAFLEVKQIKTLVLSNCQIVNISMDGFIGLNKLLYLDLSKNLLEYVPPGTFDHLTNIKELYLNGNKFKELPKEIFSKILPKLLRLNDNPWHCSCEMSDWKPMIVNKIKQKSAQPCDYSNDKGISCGKDSRFSHKYVYENRIAPKCSEPEQFVNWNVFHAMRRILKCADYKPKLRKHNKHADASQKSSEITITTALPESYHNLTKLEKLKYKMIKRKLMKKKRKLKMQKLHDMDNGNITNENESNSLETKHDSHRSNKHGVKHRKIKKRLRKIKQKTDISNEI
ncbi:unnamed protein product [Phyllotreta striolata]|uniref:Uncharacterized protein n=1 Tax=Phyllotreta striolata TaxID=444603 RepID=A0A9N9XKL5_PHYSR|nr:unnamed protein product [Phyllotreta striolata]